MANIESQPLSNVMVEVLLFASLSDLVGESRVQVELEPPFQISALLESLERAYPSMVGLRDGYRVAVDQSFVDESFRVDKKSSIALIPPVSGGDEPFVKVGPQEISIDRCLEAVRDVRCGAVVLFLGCVRNHHLGQKVSQLEYHSYEEMAHKQMKSLAQRAQEEWGAHLVALWHRTGLLMPGEVCVVVAVSSAHRKEAFESAQKLMEELKKEVPIWKKEWTDEEIVWQEGEQRIVSSPEVSKVGR